jgi:putative tryptophan/tyrosine transport system substrate-binding protein
MRRRKFITLLGGAAAAAFWPFGVNAQEPGRTYHLGVLALQPRKAPHYVAVVDELHRAGFIEGQNLVIPERGWALRVEQFPDMAAEQVKAKVDVIFCPSRDLSIRAAQRSTATIPILGVTDDTGLVPSLARQGGNTTGVSILASELDVKRLEILHEFVPQARRIAVLQDATTISTWTKVASTAHDLGVELVRFEVQSPDEIERALDAIAAVKVDAVNVLARRF